MNSKKIILASASPRRHEIMTMAGLEHTIMTADVDERSIVFRAGNAEEYVMDVAQLKNRAVAANVSDDSIVISADTIVVVGDGEAEKLLGKPVDREDAARMLGLLSGNRHRVITGVVISQRGVIRHRFAEVTHVTFRKLSKNEIIEYISTNSPMDKAGAYGIQDPEAVTIVSRIEGDYYNVVGLPICRVFVSLAEDGVSAGA